VVHNQEPPAPSGLLTNDNPDVRHSSAEVPRHQISGRVFFRAVAAGQRLSFATEENHEIRHAPVIDVRIWVSEQPASLVWIQREVLQHIFVDFLLQIDAHRSLAPDDLVRADACVGGDVSIRVWNSDVDGNVADGVMRALDGSNNQPAQKFLTGFRRAGGLRDSGGRK
jgi:hypothetical protein